MGKRSDLRKFRRRRRWAGFFLLLSLTLVVFGVMLIRDMSFPGLQPAFARTLEKAGVTRVASVRVADAPEAAGNQKEERAEFLASEEEDEKTAAEKNEVDKEAAQKADEREAAGDKAAERAQRPEPKK